MLRPLTAATLLPLVPLATACTAVATVRSPAQIMAIAGKSQGIVWVTKADNSVVQLAWPRVDGDTLVGILSQGDSLGDTVKMSLSSVQSMRARQAAPRRTLLLAGGLTLAAAGATVWYLRGSAKPDTTCPLNSGINASDECQ